MPDPERTDPGLTPLPPDAPWWARWFLANAPTIWRWAGRTAVSFALAVAAAELVDPDTVQAVLGQRLTHALQLIALLGAMYAQQPGRQKRASDPVPAAPTQPAKGGAP